VSEEVARLASQAVNARSRAALLEAFVEAARFAASMERAGDVRDGLMSMPLPFDAAARFGVDADEIVVEALEQLEPDEAVLLRAFAARADRDDIAAMHWAAEGDDGISYTFHW
jgi:hypothetical protein